MILLIILIAQYPDKEKGNHNNHLNNDQYR